MPLPLPPPCTLEHWSSHDLEPALRLEAWRQITHSWLHVGTLVWRCGFSNASEFSKQLRARFGLSPSDWHRQAWAMPG